MAVEVGGSATADPATAANDINDEEEGATGDVIGLEVGLTATVDA